jgi:hypothetical protein
MAKIITKQQFSVAPNSRAVVYPPVVQPTPTDAQIRELLRGYDEQGTLLANSAIITDSDSKVDILRCGTLYADTIDGIVDVVWENDTPINTTVGGLLSGTVLTGKSAIQILQEILYAFIPASISNFTLGDIPLNNDLSANLSNQTATFTINVSNSSSSSGFNIIYSGIQNGILVSNLPNTTTSYTATIPSGFTSITPGAQITVTLTAVQSNNSYSNATSTRNIRWWSRVYYGKSTSATLSTYTGLLSGGSYQVQTTGSNIQTASVNDENGGYIYFFVHNSRQLSSIFIGSQNATASFIQQSGGPITVSGIPYKVYRSTEIINGEVDFNVNTTPAA